MNKLVVMIYLMALVYLSIFTVMVHTMGVTRAPKSTSQPCSNNNGKGGNGGSNNGGGGGGASGIGLC